MITCPRADLLPFLTSFTIRVQQPMENPLVLNAEEGLGRSTQSCPAESSLSLTQKAVHAHLAYATFIWVSLFLCSQIPYNLQLIPVRPCTLCSYLWLQQFCIETFFSPMYCPKQLLFNLSLGAVAQENRRQASLDRYDSVFFHFCLARSYLVLCNAFWSLWAPISSRSPN